MPKFEFRKVRSMLIALFLLPTTTLTAHAHPHVWMDVKTNYEIDAGHKLSAITITWTFDEFYSSFAVGDFKKQPDGSYAQKDLDSLLKLNLDNLKDPVWHYFTEVKQNGKMVKFKDAIARSTSYDKKLGRLTSSFTLPFETPLIPSEKAPVKIRIFDPTFYIDLEYVKKDPIQLTGDGKDGCHVATKIPNAEYVWAHLPKSAFTGGDGSAAEGFGSYFASTTTLTCPAS